VRPDGSRVRGARLAVASGMPHETPAPTRFCIHWRSAGGCSPARQLLPEGTDFDSACRNAREWAPPNARWVDVIAVSSAPGSVPFCHMVTHQRWRSTKGGLFVAHSTTDDMLARVRSLREEASLIERLTETVGIVRVALARLGLPSAERDPEPDMTHCALWSWTKSAPVGERTFRFDARLRLDASDLTRLTWECSAVPYKYQRDYEKPHVPFSGEYKASGEVLVIDRRRVEFPQIVERAIVRAALGEIDDP